MKRLSIFIDESGDFGEYDFHSPYYIISMVMHDQCSSILKQLTILDTSLSQIGYSDHCIHSGPIIRQEDEYRYVPIEKRQKILKVLMKFIRNIDIKYHCFYIEKKHISNKHLISEKLHKQISDFIKNNYSYFLSFDSIIIYYDNGQVELNKILSSVFDTHLDNVEFRKVLPSDYRLFQIADLICTLKLSELKMTNHSLSKSEIYFFTDERTLKKNYIKPLLPKQI